MTAEKSQHITGDNWSPGHPVLVASTKSTHGSWSKINLSVFLDVINNPGEERNCFHFPTITRNILKIKMNLLRRFAIDVRRSVNLTVTKLDFDVSSHTSR